MIDSTVRAKVSPLRAYSMAGLLGLLLAITLFFGVDYFSELNSIVRFYTQGQFPEQPVEPYIEVAMNLVALLLMKFCTAISIAIPIETLKPSTSNQAIGEVLKQGSGIVFLGAWLEEVIFRLLPLEGLPQDMPLSVSSVAILSSCIFALIHLANWSDSAERSVIHVLPHFFSGLFYAYIFLLYGLIATVLVHLFHNTLAAIIVDLKPPTPPSTRSSYFIVCLCLLDLSGLYAASRQLEFGMLIAHWDAFDLSSIYGLSFGDFLAYLLFLFFLTEVVSEMLLLDELDIEAQPQRNWFFECFNIFCVLICICGLNWLLALCIYGDPARITLIVLILGISFNQTNGSSMARQWIVRFPAIWFLVVKLTSGSFWQALVILGVFVVAHYIPRLFCQRTEQLA